MKRATRGVTLHAEGIARAIVAGNDNGGCTRHEDPGASHLLREEKSSKCASPPCGTPRGRVVLVYLSPVRLPPDPARRHMHRANAWRRLVAGSPRQVGVPRCRASLDFFESLTGSPQALSAARTARPASPRQAGPSNRVAAGHLNAQHLRLWLPSPLRSAVTRRRDTSHWRTEISPTRTKGDGILHAPWTGWY